MDEVAKPNVDDMMSKTEDPRIRQLTTTKTTWANFHTMATQIRRDPQHILDFFKAELDVEGNFGSDGNLIIAGKWQAKHITNLWKQYLKEYVRCRDCLKLNTDLTRDSATRLQNMTCLDCNATRTVERIKSGYHAVKRGERRKAKN